MFYEFSHRHTPCVVDGNEDTVILSRETKATTVMGKEYVYNGVFAPESLVNRGSLVQTEYTFLVLTLRKTVDQDNYCSLVKTIAVVEVQRHQQLFGENDNPIGTEFVTAASDVVCFAQYVTAQLRQQEPGLLPSTVFVLQMQTTVDVKDPQDPELSSPIGL